MASSGISGYNTNGLELIRNELKTEFKQKLAVTPKKFLIWQKMIKIPITANRSSDWFSAKSFLVNLSTIQLSTMLFCILLLIHSQVWTQYLDSVSKWIWNSHFCNCYKKIILNYPCAWVFKNKYFKNHILCVLHTGLLPFHINRKNQK